MIEVLLLMVSPAMGSFAALAAWRAARGETVLAPPSRCEACGAGLSAGELVPVVSWIAQRGRSRCCGQPLRRSLLGAELGALVLTGWAVWAVPPALAVPSAVLGWALLALALTDVACQRLPDWGTLPLIPIGLALSAMGLTGPLAVHALGAVAGYLAFAGIAWGYRRVRGAEGLGLGDAKLLAAAGAWLGVLALPSVVLVGAGASLAALAIAGGGRSPRRAVPFGPGLALGFWLVWLHGPLVLG